MGGRRGSPGNDPAQSACRATLRPVTTLEPRHIRLVDDDAPDVGSPSSVTAGGEVRYPLAPPSEWFGDPNLSGPTTLQIEDSGRVYGHVAAFGVNHIGLPGQVTAPRSRMEYRRFRTGNMITADGSSVRVGRLTMDAPHAPMNLAADATSRHYDESGSIIAFVASGEDQWGIWVAGSLRPDISPADVVVARGCPLSGDWREVNGNLELVAALAVPVNGFEIPEPLARVASGMPMSLVACGVVMPDALTAANSDPDGTVYEDGSVKGGKKKSSGGGGSSGWDESKHPRDAIGQWAPKDEAGKQAQRDAGARSNYGKLEGASDADADKMLRGMSDTDLRKLTAFAYSSKTSDPRIVKARIKVANEMGRRGIDIKKHGARGGGKKSATRASAEPVAAPETEVQVESVNEDDVDVAGLLAAGDGPPAPHDKPAADADDSDDKAGQVSFAEGDRVTIGDTGLSGHVQSVDDGQAHVSVTVKVEALTAAEDDEDEAVAAAADPNTSMLEGLTASVSALTDMVASMQAERRAEKAQSILDGLG